MKKISDTNIPRQVKGKHIDICRERKFRDLQTLQNAFSASRKKLLDVNRWNHIAGCNSSRFFLQHDNQQKVDRSPAIGDYVKIDIPGPGPLYGGGFDWVTVSRYDDRPDESYVMLRLQPSPPATQKDNDKVAHFFKAYSSTTLIVQADGDTLKVSYHGRNEEINTDNENIMDDIRNYMVGLGAKIGLSYPQWEKLVEGILGEE